jgi:hypothetical protein
VKSRREFLTHTPLALLGAAVASYAQTQNPAQQQTPGAPPAFGTAPAVGPEVTPATFAEAEKLVQMQMTPAELAEAAGNWRMAMAPLYEMRVGPRKATLEPTLAPATIWDPVSAGRKVRPAQNRFVRSKFDPGPLPSNDEDIAFASVTQLSGWIEQRKLTSERLTNIYLKRLQQYDPKLHCVITLTSDLALSKPSRPTPRSQPGNIAGRCTAFPGARRIFSILPAFPQPTAPSLSATACLRRMPSSSSVSMMPARCWSPSSVGRAGAQRHLVRRPDHESVAAGRRIVRLKRRAGRGNGRGARRLRHRQRDRRQHCQPVDALWNHWTTADLRPRRPHGSDDAVLVARQAWPMARYVEDTMLVLNTITGPDPGDLSSLPSKFDFDANASVQGLRVGYFPAWMKEAPATDVDRAALEAVRKVGMVPVEVSLPDWPYDSLDLILFAEGAAAFRRADAIGRARSA